MTVWQEILPSLGDR